MLPPLAIGLPALLPGSEATDWEEGRGMPRGEVGVEPCRLLLTTASAIAGGTCRRCSGQQQTAMDRGSAKYSTAEASMLFKPCHPSMRLAVHGHMLVLLLMLHCTGHAVLSLLLPTWILRLCIHLASMMLSSDIASLDSAAAAAASAACPAGCGECSAVPAGFGHSSGEVGSHTWLAGLPVSGSSGKPCYCPLSKPQHTWRCHQGDRRGRRGTQARRQRP